MRLLKLSIISLIFYLASASSVFSSPFEMGTSLTTKLKVNNGNLTWLKPGARSLIKKSYQISLDLNFLKNINLYNFGEFSLSKKYIKSIINIDNFMFENSFDSISVVNQQFKPLNRLGGKCPFNLIYSSDKLDYLKKYSELSILQNNNIYTIFLPNTQLNGNKYIFSKLTDSENFKLNLINIPFKIDDLIITLNALLNPIFR